MLNREELQGQSGRGSREWYSKRNSHQAEEVSMIHQKNLDSRLCNVPGSEQRSGADGESLGLSGEESWTLSSRQ